MQTKLKVFARFMGQVGLKNKGKYQRVTTLALVLSFFSTIQQRKELDMHASREMSRTVSVGLERATHTKKKGLGISKNS